MPLWKVGLFTVVCVGGVLTIAREEWAATAGTRAQKFSWKALSRYSKRVLGSVDRTIKGLNGALARKETLQVITKLGMGERVILKGEGGTGKTGIVAELAERIGGKRPVFVLDARDVYGCDSFEDIARRLEIGDVGICETIRLWGHKKHAILMVDQCDSIWRSELRYPLLDMLKECAKEPRLGIVLVIRKHEGKGLENLESLGFSTTVVEVQPLSESDTKELLARLGISEPSARLLAICENLLNLSMVADLVAERGTEATRDIDSEMGLWERYRLSLDREEPGRELRQDVLARAVALAANCLKSDRFMCDVGLAPSREDERLLSRGIVVETGVGRMCRFRHEKFRDYLYAWDAVQRGLSYGEVFADLGERTGVVAEWMLRLYGQVQSDAAASFFEQAIVGNAANG